MQIRNSRAPWATAPTSGNGSRERARKGRKGNDGEPSISHSSHARLKGYVKLGEVQNLVLYLLADGTAPQWCLVNNHSAVRKVVVLMVPGLELSMFQGPEALPAAGSDVGGDQSADMTAMASKQGTDSTVSAAESSKDAPGSLSRHQESKPQQQSASRKASPDDYYPIALKRNQLAEPLQPLSDIFEHVWPVQAPGDAKYAKMHSPIGSILISPIPKAAEGKGVTNDHRIRGEREWKNKRVPITKLVAETHELIEEGFILHPAHYKNTTMAKAEEAKRTANKATTADGWVDTPNVTALHDSAAKDQVAESCSPMDTGNVIALDCEMCVTSPTDVKPPVLSLTRVSIVDWAGKTIFDELVKPADPITDYVTMYSGITASMLEGVTITVEDIQKKLMSDILSPQTVIVGHSVVSDLAALKITHPFVADTSMLFPHPRGPPLKSSLKWLAKTYLKREIQKGHGTTGHSSIEDAKASLDLVKQKCEKGKDWATPVSSSESIFRRLARHPRPRRDKRNDIGPVENREGAMIDWGDATKGYGIAARTAMSCDDDAQVVRSVQHCVAGGDGGDDADIPPGGVDFIFARLRELEYRRGWQVGHDPKNQTTNTSSSPTISDIITQTTTNIATIWFSLPPCTAFVVLSGSGDPRDLVALQALNQRFREEFKTKKWDQLSVKWTDDEEMALRAACDRARKGLGLFAVK